MSSTIDIRSLIDRIEATVRPHQLDRPGAYQRWQIVAADRKCLLRTVEFADIDWVYSINRSLRQCNHRFGECQTALQANTTKYCAMLSSLDPAKDENWNDLHKLFGATCALAELQAALPGVIRTEAPLRLVLDRRPLI
jgi:hypothetical protein